MSRRLVNRALILVDRLLLKLFFRQIEVVGAENFPLSGPLLVVANHGNALVDPGLIFGFLPRPGRFLAKSTLWRHPFAKHLVRLAGAIPVYRRQEADTSKNESTFSRCHEVLAAGGVIGIFPEGTSHLEPSLLPLKTGVSRIALEAEERFGPLGVGIVPVGLNFEERDRFRSRVLIQVGPVIEVVSHLELYRENERAAVRRLTDLVDQALRGVTLNFDSWREAEVVDCAAHVYARAETEAPLRENLEESFALRKAFLAGYRELRQTHPEIVHAVYEAADEYDRLLREVRLEDRQVAASYPAALVARFTLRSLWTLFLWRPLALIGLVLNWLPYKLGGWAVRVFKVAVDSHATFKLLIAAVALPSTWILEAALAAWWWSWEVGLVVLLLAPASGYVALFYGETWRAFRRETRAYLKLRGRRQAVAELKARRRELWAQIAHLVEVLRRTPAQDDSARA